VLLLKILAILLISAVTLLTFLTEPPLVAMQSGGEASRLFYFHVPIAQVSFLSFMVAAIYAIVYLRKRRADFDRSAATAAEIGLIFSVVALITGALWAKQAWGAYWNWDPRQLFLFALVLFYGAFFALRQATTNSDTKRRVSAVYLIFGGAISPFLFFVLPRLYRSLHEDANEVVMSAGSQSTMSPQVATIFGASILGFLLLYIWMFKLGVAAARIEDGAGSDPR
jgi:heme exporter protein C